MTEKEKRQLCFKLRDLTGEDLESCKAALLANDFDFEAAVQWLDQKKKTVLDLKKEQEK